jgi:ubiquinone/menaquinone biosynthesis C-methylase UbiE
MKNAFGLENPEIKEIVTDVSVKQTIQSMLLPVLTYLGISADQSNKIILDCMKTASSYKQVEDYEAEAHAILDEAQVCQRIPEKLHARAHLMHSQVESYLLQGTVLDYGCGDGQVAECIAKNKNQIVTVTDVYQHNHVQTAGLNFKMFRQGETAPFQDEAFDNTLALTIFHHSSDPVNSVKDVCRVTKKGGRVLVIESVYGVDGKQLPPMMQKKIGTYLALSAEQQRKVNIFFDHFYNRVLHYSPNAETKVNVPFNFNNPQGWKKLFATCGLKQETVVHLGLDQPTAPEYHTMHVLRRV